MINEYIKGFVFLNHAITLHIMTLIFLERRIKGKKKMEKKRRLIIMRRRKQKYRKISLTMAKTPDMTRKTTGFEFDKNFVSIDTSKTD